MIQLSRKQTLGLLILCGAVILHATMWPYNFRFDWGSVPAMLLSAIRGHPDASNLLLAALGAAPGP